MKKMFKLNLFYNKLIKLFIVIFLLIFSLNTVKSQTTIKDTLLTKSYEELEKLYYNYLTNNSEISKQIAKTFLIKAKKDNDTIKIAGSYYLFSFLYNAEEGLKYADSIITLTKNSNHKFYPAVGYLLKGYWSYELNDFNRSLENYLIAHNLALKKNNIKQINDIRPMIATLKNRTGDYQGALEIYSKHLRFLNENKDYKNKNYKEYLIMLFNISLSYMHLKKMDSACLYIRKGIKESLQKKDTAMYHDFLFNSGTANYYNGNYNISLDSLNKVIPHTNKFDLAMAFYYKQECYRKLNKRNEAFRMAVKTDSISENINYNFPELRNTYEFLIDFYGSKNSSKNQLKYMDKILQLDSILLTVKSLDAEIARKYDAPCLLNEKDKKIKNIEGENNKAKFIEVGLLLLIVVLLFIVFNYRKKQKFYLKRYKELLSQNESKIVKKEINEHDRLNSGVSSHIYKKIIIDLDNFEKNKGYLNPKITLNSLAKEINTNTSYLSKVININKEMNFSTYINTLKIENIVKRLKHDSKLRLYTIKAVASEAGYSTPESFSKSFCRITGVYPSYFIQKLNEEEK